MNFEAIRCLFANHLRENDLHISLSHDMPQGYETAYGTYDPVLGALFLNPALIEKGAAHEVAFYLFHELRHAMQYAHPVQFDEPIRMSLPYVVLYDGSCFKLSDGKWLECHLDGEQADFLRAYQNLPYEVDANRFAYEQAVKIFPEQQNALRELLDFWLPKEPFSPEEYAELFARIEQNAQ